MTKRNEINRVKVEQNRRDAAVYGLLVNAAALHLPCPSDTKLGVCIGAPPSGAHRCLHRLVERGLIVIDKSHGVNVRAVTIVATGRTTKPEDARRKYMIGAERARTVKKLGRKPASEIEKMADRRPGILRHTAQLRGYKFEDVRLKNRSYGG